MENEKYSMVWIFTAVLIILGLVLLRIHLNFEKLEQEGNNNNSIIYNPYN